MERITVPFHMSDIGLDMSAQIDTEGVVRIDADALIIEYRETRTSLSSLRKEVGAVRVVSISMNDLESVEVRRRRLFASHLRIRTRTLVALADVPGSSANEAVLPIRRRDHDRARELAATTSLLLSSRDIQRLEGQRDDID